MINLKALCKALTTPVVTFVVVGLALGIPFYMLFGYNNPWGIYTLLGLMGLFLLGMLVSIIIEEYHDALVSDSEVNNNGGEK